jgi:hypothetical protein
MKLRTIADFASHSTTRPRSTVNQPSARSTSPAHGQPPQTHRQPAQTHGPRAETHRHNQPRRAVNQAQTHLNQPRVTVNQPGTPSTMALGVPISRLRQKPQARSLRPEASGQKPHVSVPGTEARPAHVPCRSIRCVHRIRAIMYRCAHSRTGPAVRSWRSHD